MYDPRTFPGGAIPPRWTIGAAKELRSRSDRANLKQVGGVDLITDHGLSYSDWPARDQGRRGTCTAFAVAAAEELVDRLHRGRPGSQVSVEYLYSQMRGVSFADLSVAISPVEAGVFEASGATFIEQAKLALERTGRIDEATMPYDPSRPVNYKVTHIPMDIAVAAGNPAAGPGDLVHDIVDPDNGPLYGHNRIWKNAPDNRPVSDLFIEQLRRGFPVVAGFPILRHIGIDIWLGQRAVRFGEVVYPVWSVADTLDQHSGHVVCLTGFNAAYGGHFVFRNSYGSFGFARDRDHDRRNPVSPSRGYGLISLEDVDTFCWEYLFRVNA